MRALAMLVMMTGAAMAEAPQATSATYGNWTLGCQAQDGAQDGAQACQIVTRLNVKGQDGQVRPLLSMALIKPGKDFGLRLELPPGVDLRAAARLDPTGATEGDPLAVFTFLTCEPGGCLAEALVAKALVDQMVAAEAMDVSFTLFAGGKVVRVPVSLKGFGDAVRALK
jgi:invasion protein IalB